LAPVVALTGFMGSGKTSVGAAAAALLDWSFIDLDSEVERALGVSIPEVFLQKGEEAFRRAELETLRSVLLDGRSSRGVLLALGGGTLIDPEAARVVKDAGFVIYLRVDPATAWRRVAESDRPLATDETSFEALFARRAGVYENAADATVTVEQKSVRKLAREIAVLSRGLTSESP